MRAGELGRTDLDWRTHLWTVFARLSTSTSTCRCRSEWKEWRTARIFGESQHIEGNIAALYSSGDVQYRLL